MTLPALKSAKHLMTLCGLYDVYASLLTHLKARLNASRWETRSKLVGCLRFGLLSRLITIRTASIGVPCVGLVVQIVSCFLGTGAGVEVMRQGADGALITDALAGGIDINMPMCARTIRAASLPLPAGLPTMGLMPSSILPRYAAPRRSGNSAPSY